MSQNSLARRQKTTWTERPVARSRPEYLAVIGTLRGMQPPDASEVRVLELGCGSGQNLIPMALGNPGSTFLGIDSRARSLAVARQTASVLGLGNIMFRRQDVRELDDELGTFDYVIACDVYSTADYDTRDRILAFCRDHLSPQGLAYIGYQTYPAGHVDDLLRAMIRYDTRGVDTASQQMATARTLLEFLDASLVASTPFDKLVRDELRPVLQQPDEALHRKYVAQESRPVFVSQFIADAKEHALKLAGDCALGVRSADYLGDEVEQRLDSLTTDPVKKEVYRDMLRNRAFREAVLCHAAVPLNHGPTPQLLAGMYLESAVRPQGAPVDLTSTAVERFVTPDGLQISTAVPLIKASLLHLGSIWPATMRFEELVAASCAAVEAASGNYPTAASEIERLKDNLLLCCTGGIIELVSRPGPFTTRISPCPVASPLARWQVEHGDVATNCRHRAVRLDYFDQFVLRFLDGTRDVSLLLDHLAELAADGRLSMWEGTQPVRSRQRAREILEIMLPQSLARLAQNAFLVR